MDKKSTWQEIAIPAEVIERKIYLIRGHKVMLDSDLAELYQVLTKNLNLAVRRNAKRFPEDFMFQLTKEEAWAVAVVDISHMPSPNSVSPCSRQSSVATAPSK